MSNTEQALKYVYANPTGEVKNLLCNITLTDLGSLMTIGFVEHTGSTYSLTELGERYCKEMFE